MKLLRARPMNSLRPTVMFASVRTCCGARSMVKLDAVLVRLSVKTDSEWKLAARLHQLMFAAPAGGANWNTDSA